MTSKYNVYSHCGYLVSGDILDIKGLSPGKFAVLELTCSGAIAQDETIDLMTGSHRLGLQVRSFDERNNQPINQSRWPEVLK